MVIERFEPDKIAEIGRRFQQNGRMLPVGVIFHASWIDSAGTRCFQLMESASAEMLDEWVQRWNDLVAFEIIPVMTSSEFWAAHAAGLGSFGDGHG